MEVELALTSADGDVTENAEIGFFVATWKQHMPGPWLGGRARARGARGALGRTAVYRDPGGTSSRWMQRLERQTSNLRAEVRLLPGPLRTLVSAQSPTSGTALGGFGFELGVAGIQTQLKQAPNVLAAQAALEPRTTGLEHDELNRADVVAVAAGIALLLVECPQPHGLDRKLHIGR
jgi:hypothetical protein